MQALHQFHGAVRMPHKKQVFNYCHLWIGTLPYSRTNCHRKPHTLNQNITLSITCMCVLQKKNNFIKKRSELPTWVGHLWELNLLNSPRYSQVLLRKRCSSWNKRSLVQILRSLQLKAERWFINFLLSGTDMRTRTDLETHRSIPFGEGTPQSHLNWPLRWRDFIKRFLLYF